ncbi:DUF6470 family protein [Paenibacillus sp. NPDC057967]|uniref:DUF6470 family protein n=1 Tax=Paenibacillus sp. NPDC057967 TaxID=3346293 RepID=UPI0036D7DFA9
MNDLRLSIRQSFALIGMDSTPTRQVMESPRGEQQIEQPPARMEFSSTASQLNIDSSEAWMALGRGPHMDWNQRLYGQMKSVFLQNLAQTVEAGSRMAQITNPRSAFADLGRQSMSRESLVDYQLSKPNYNNVKFDYTPSEVDTVIEPSKVEVNYIPMKPDIQVEQGKLDIYLRQKNSIAIEVSTYDWYK